MIYTREQMKERYRQEQAYHKRRQKTHWLGNWARAQVAKTIRKGLLPRLSYEWTYRWGKNDTNIPCVDCGKRANCWDHRDYCHPLKVDPVCASCNRLRGPGFPYMPLLPRYENPGVNTYDALEMMVNRLGDPTMAYPDIPQLRTK